MKNVLVNADGDLLCPACGAKQQFSYRRTRGAKLAAGITVGVGMLAAPKRLQCLGCKEYLKTPAISTEASAPVYSSTGQSVRQQLNLPVGEVQVFVTDCEWDGPARVKMLQAARPGLTASGYQRILDDLLAKRPAHVASLTAAGAATLKAQLEDSGFTVAVDGLHNAEPAAAVDVVGQLERLADLHERGVLSDEEFTAQKTKLLG